MTNDLFNPTYTSEEKKSRKITIIKQEVYNEVQSITYKYGEAALDQVPVRAKDASVSDMDETVDSLLIKRGVEYYEARLRTRIKFRLADEEITEVNDNIQSSPNFVYNLQLPVSFQDASLQAIAVKIHEFLVWGGLWKWYLEHGYTAQAAAYERDLQEMEDEIVSALRAPNRARRPLQPFGPAQKIF